MQKCVNGHGFIQEEKELFFEKIKAGLDYVEQGLSFNPIQSNGDITKSRRGFNARVIVLIEILHY